jgi:hypothetical protein
MRSVSLLRAANRPRKRDEGSELTKLCRRRNALLLGSTAKRSTLRKILCYHLQD